MDSARNSCLFAAASVTVLVRRGTLKFRHETRRNSNFSNPAAVLVICSSSTNVAELPFHELPAAAFTFQRSVVLLKYLYSVLSFIIFHPNEQWCTRGSEGEFWCYRKHTVSCSMSPVMSRAYFWHTFMHNLLSGGWGVGTCSASYLMQEP